MVADPAATPLLEKPLLARATVSIPVDFVAEELRGLEAEGNRIGTMGPEEGRVM